MSTQGELVEEKASLTDQVVEVFSDRMWLVYFLVVEFIVVGTALVLDFVSDDTVTNPNNDLTVIAGLVGAWAVFIGLLVAVFIVISVSLSVYSQYRDMRV